MNAREAELSGRSVIVTGASRGIGAAVCEELAARGARVVAVARAADALDAVVGDLPGDGHLARAMDVTDVEAWPPLVSLAATGGSLHGLVTAAAVLEPIGPTGKVPPPEFLETLRINLYGTFLAIHYALPALRAAEQPSIVTFSGGGATGPLPRYDAYAASKAAVVRLTENVAAGEPGVRANSVAPGFVATSMHQLTLAAGDERAGAEYVERTRLALESGGTPPGRAAALVATLLGPQGAGISGKLISAAWDPWEDSAFRGRLRREAAFCTLRRIDGVSFATAPARE